MPNSYSFHTIEQFKDKNYVHFKVKNDLINNQIIGW